MQQIGGGLGKVANGQRLLGFLPVPLPLIGGGRKRPPEMAHGPAAKTQEKSASSERNNRISSSVCHENIPRLPFRS
jgi:hypothetical protein